MTSPVKKSLLKRVWDELREEDDILDASVALDLCGVDQADATHPFRGSLPGKRPNVDRGFQEGARRIHLDYFADDPVYNDAMFRRRFRMRRTLFLRVVNDLRLYDPWFEQQFDALKRPGPTPFQKIIAAMRIIAYGSVYDAVDEYVWLSETLASDCLVHFCNGIAAIYGGEYLREPNVNDLERLLRESSLRGLPGCIGSINCCNWAWDNCPVAYQGSYKGSKGVAFVLEAAASYDLWIWHAFFGMPGALNDVNVLERSPLLNSFVNGTSHRVVYIVNGKQYTLPYWLADGIYPNWPVFAKTIPDPHTMARKCYASLQESMRKDIERAFGVLKKRFAILKNPARQWTVCKLKQIMTACIILHNMIIEDERDVDSLDFDYDINVRKTRKKGHKRYQRRTARTRK
ncbi:hypothetical protein AeMF1_020579 [Aphanomyces euteiches]|nr:hypothetical protein AeMF1_020579 [Aphanomyces euteiches]